MKSKEVEELRGGHQIDHSCTCTCIRITILATLSRTSRAKRCCLEDECDFSSSERENRSSSSASPSPSCACSGEPCTSCDSRTPGVADRAGEGPSAASATWIGGGWLLGQLATNTLPREIPVATYIKQGLQLYKIQIWVVIVYIRV